MSDLVSTSDSLGLAVNFDKMMRHLALALDDVRDIPDTMDVHERAEMFRVLARQAGDKTAQAEFAELTMRAERKLGEQLIESKAQGLFAPTKPTKDMRSSGERITLADVGIDRKLSHKAQALAKSPEAIFEDVVRQAREKILAGKMVVINPIKDVTKREKQIRRQVKEAQLAGRAKALPKDMFQLIYADPEWKFETWSEGGLDRAADNHYPTSDLAAIKQRPVGTLAAKDCVLFMWVTAPFHAAGHGAAVMRYWGFEPKAEWIWDKIDQATGYWNRNQHEILLVGTRGDVPAPAPGTQYPSVISSRPGLHSEKPDWAYELIEHHFPNLKKIELNARRRRAGWDAWGLEAPTEIEFPAVAEGDNGDASERAEPVTERPAPISVSPDGEGAADDGEGDDQSVVLARPMTRAEAEPILRKHYATSSGAELSVMLGGVSINTIRTWAHRLGLTSKARIVASGQAWAAEIHGAAPQHPAEETV